MQPFTVHTGIAATLPRVNVDTDQIIPKQFLKRIERTGFGKHLFHDWRYLPDGSPDPAFELNAPKAQGASILVGGPELRVRVVAGARALGAGRLRLSRGHRAVVRRYLL